MRYITPYGAFLLLLVLAPSVGAAPPPDADRPMCMYVPPVDAGPDPPTLPQEWVVTEYSAPQGGIVRWVGAGEDLQAVLDAANRGDIVEIEAGATFTGQFVLRDKPGTGWIELRSSAHHQLPPPGNRIWRAHASLMPKLVSPVNGPALSTDYGADHYRVVGLELTTSHYPFDHGIVRIGTDGTAYTKAETLAELPSHIVFDRIYVHGGPNEEDLHFGIVLNGVHSAVVDSHIAEVKSRQSDAKGIYAFNTPGPLKVVNNHIEGASEVMMISEDIVPIPDVIPSDIEVRCNHFYKKPEWEPALNPTNPYFVKNSFEIKSGRRVLIDSNVFENNWPGAQDGYAILFTVRDIWGSFFPSPDYSRSEVDDIAFTRNLLVGVEAGFEMAGEDSRSLANDRDQPERILIHNNLILARKDAFHIGLGSDNQVSTQPVNALTITRNTFVHHGIEDPFDTSGGFWSATFGLNAQAGPIPIAESGLVEENLFSHGKMGVKYTGVSPGTESIALAFANIPFANNTMFNYDWLHPYPATTTMVQDPHDVGFADYANDDFRITPYLGIGADVSALQPIWDYVKGCHWADTDCSGDITIPEFVAVILDWQVGARTNAQLEEVKLLWET